MYRLGKAYSISPVFQIIKINEFEYKLTVTYKELNLNIEMIVL
jgi:hypothetical protein